MSYIGRGTESISNVEVLDNLTFNGSASYTLQKSSTNFVPSSANNLLISISGVVQQGNFSVSGSTITFDTTVSASDTCDWILHYGTGLITTVADGAITEAKLGSNAVTTAKINNGAITSAKLDSGLALGKIGQVVISNFNTGNVQTTSNSFVATGHIASITPSSTSSKVLVSLNMGDGYMSETTGNLGVRVHCNSSGSYVDVSNNGFRLRSAPNAINTGGGSLMILDSPNSTSSISYQAFFNYDGSGTAVYYHNSSSFQTTMTLMEVLA